MELVKAFFQKIFEVISFKSTTAKVISRYIFAIIAIIIILMFLSITSQEKVLNNNFEKNNLFITKILAESIGEPAAAKNFLFLDNLLSILLNNQQDILYIIIISDAKDVLISTIESYNAKNNNELKDVFSPLAVNDKLLTLRKKKDPFIRAELLNEKETIDRQISEFKKENTQFSSLLSLKQVNKKIENTEFEITAIGNSINILESKMLTAIKNQDIASINKITKTIEEKRANINKLLNDDSILTEFRRLFDKLRLTNELINRVASDNMIYEVSSPIGKSIGIIRIGFSPKSVKTMILEIYLVSFIIGVLFILIGLGVAIQLSAEHRNLAYMVELRTKELNESLNRFKQLNIHLQEALDQKNRFLATMSHELRTPLNAIIGFSNMLKQKLLGGLNEKQEKFVNNIFNAGTHLLGLINDILEIVVIEANPLELKIEEFYINEFVSEMTTLMSTQFEEKKVSLTFNSPDGLLVKGCDKLKTKQILLNLLTNSLKFTPEGGSVKIDVKKIDTTAKISVTDTGIGIDKKDFDKVFDVFYRTKEADEKAIGGSGIGLAVCKRLVEMQGGNIGIESELNKGSTFWFTLPLKSDLEVP